MTREVSRWPQQESLHESRPNRLRLISSSATQAAATCMTRKYMMEGDIED